MHAAALAYVAAHCPLYPDAVLEFGARNINGSCRSIVNAKRYVGVDIAEGDGVDIVADASLVALGETFDAVICAEVFEHADDDTCQRMVVNAFQHLKHGGRFVATMAGPGRQPHSAIDGGAVRDGEFYRNVDASTLAAWLTDAGFAEAAIDSTGEDTRCWAERS